MTGPEADDAAGPDDDEVDVVAGRELLESVAATGGSRQAEGRSRQRRPPRSPRPRLRRCACSASRAVFRPLPARRPGTVGIAGQDSTAWRPIEPVEPRTPPGRRPDRPPGSMSADDGEDKSVTTGAAKRNESTRSRMPPWPGMSVPESFAPAARFSIDSARSPAWAAAARSGPRSSPISRWLTEAPRNAADRRACRRTKPPTSPA